MAEYKYKAFISYSHADQKWARWLHRALEAYRIPRSVAGNLDPATRLKPIFQDREELAASDSLSEAITDALAESECLIVICSPSAASSKWVNEEVRQYLAQASPDRVFCLFVEGAPNDAGNECLPEVLRGADDPLAADVRPEADGKQLALLKLVAGMSGVDLARLRDRDARRRNRRLLQITAASVLGVLLTGGLAVAAYLAENEARRQTALAEEALEFSLDFFDAANPAVARRSDITAREVLETGVRRIAELDGQPEMKARMSSAVAEVYYDLGEIDKSREMLEDAIALRQALYGASDERTLKDRILYGRVLTRLANFQQAEPRLRSAIADAEQALGPNHAVTLTARGALAIWMVESGDLPAARTELEALYLSKQTTLGGDDVSTLKTAASLIVVYQRSGMIEDAATVAEVALAAARKTLPKADVLTLGLISNLAGSYLGMQKLEAARDLYAEHLQLTLEVYGEENVATARSKANLGMVHAGLGDFELAELLQREAITQQRVLLGERHPVTLRSRANYVNTLNELQRFDEAIEQVLEVEALQAEVLGATHWDTLFTRLTRGIVLASSGALEASAYLDALEPVLTANLGADHPHLDTLEQVKALIVDRD